MYATQAIAATCLSCDKHTTAVRACGSLCPQCLHCTLLRRCLSLCARLGRSASDRSGLVDQPYATTSATGSIQLLA